METVKLQIHKDDKCPICGQLFMNEKKELVKSIIKEERLGTVHDGCILPYFQEEGLKINFEVSCYSMGDTIATTPVLRELKKIYPRAQITVTTSYPDIFKYNPYINLILDFNREIPKEMFKDYSFTVKSFDTTLVGHFAMHSVEFSALSAFRRSLMPHNWEYEVYYSNEETKSMHEVMKKNGIDLDKDKLILFNPHGTEWETRDWGKVHAKEFAEWIMKTYPDYKLVSIGGKRSEVPRFQMKNYVEIPCHVDLYGQLTLLESISFFNASACKLLITPDTGTLHLAACAKELPILGIFTVIRSEFRTPVRNRQLGYKFIGINADNPCNCTYQSKWLTHEMRFDKCPKKALLENIMRHNIPKSFKIEGLKNYSRAIEWNPDEGLQKQIMAELKQFTGSSLPCFPEVDKVKQSVEKALNEFAR